MTRYIWLKEQNQKRCTKELHYIRYLLEIEYLSPLEFFRFFFFLGCVFSICRGGFTEIFQPTVLFSNTWH